MQFPVDSTSHLHTHYIANNSCAWEYFKNHNNGLGIHRFRWNDHWSLVLYCCMFTISLYHLTHNSHISLFYFILFFFLYHMIASRTTSFIIDFTIKYIVSFCVGCILLDKIIIMYCCWFHKDAVSIQSL
jgi:hypothetical protein